MSVRLFIYLFSLFIFFAIAALPHTSSATTITQTLSVGSEGEEVSLLQQTLKQLGYFTYPSITGFYGGATWKAVAAFQWDNGLESVGFVGPKTRALLAKLTENSTASGTSSPSPLPSETGSATLDSTAASTTLCNPPPGLTCIPGTYMIQPYAPGNGYTPGFGGGGGPAATLTPTPTPSISDWLPSGALTFLDFKNGHYYAGGKEISASDAVSDTSGIVAGVGLTIANNSSPVDILGDALTSLSTTSMTVVIEVDTTNGLGGYYLVAQDALDVSEYGLYRSNFSGECITSFGSSAFQPGGDLCTTLPSAGVNKLAATFTLLRRAFSVNGGSVLTDTTDLTGIEAHTSVTLGSNTGVQNIYGDLLIHSITVYEARSDSDLSGLSTQ